MHNFRVIISPLKRFQYLCRIILTVKEVQCRIRVKKEDSKAIGARRQGVLCTLIIDGGSFFAPPVFISHSLNFRN